MIKNDNFIGNWWKTILVSLFTQPAESQVQEILAGFPDLKLLDHYEMTYAEWQGGNIEPVRIGRFLNPTWIKAPPGKNDIAITLDSGVVFGNGTHPQPRPALRPSILPARVKE